MPRRRRRQATRAERSQLRVAAIGPFKFPAAAGPGATLEARARVAGRMGGLFKIEGTVTADGVLVASGSLTLAAKAGLAPSSRSSGHALNSV